MTKPTSGEVNRAVRSGDVEQLAALLKAGGDPNGLHEDRFRRERPLEAAADEGSKKAVAMLLEAGADPNPEPVGRIRPALAVAVSNDGKKYVDVVRLLIEAGANVNYATLSEAGKPSNTVLSSAAGHARPEVVAMLIEAGADVNAFPSLGTPFMQAAGEGRVENMQVLVDHGADVSVRYPEDLDWHYAGFDALDIAKSNKKKKAIGFIEALPSR